MARTFFVTGTFSAASSRTNGRSRCGVAPIRQILALSTSSGCLVTERSEQCLSIGGAHRNLSVDQCTIVIRTTANTITAFTVANWRCALFTTAVGPGVWASRIAAPAATVDAYLTGPAFTACLRIARTAGGAGAGVIRVAYRGGIQIASGKSVPLVADIASP